MMRDRFHLRPPVRLMGRVANVVRVCFSDQAYREMFNIRTHHTGCCYIGRICHRRRDHHLGRSVLAVCEI